MRKIEANNDEVICPNCVHQFRAIPVNVQEKITALAAENKVLRDAARQGLDAVENLLRWATNWDSEFMNDHDWKTYDSRKVESAISALTAALTKEAANG